MHMLLTGIRTTGTVINSKGIVTDLINLCISCFRGIVDIEKEAIYVYIHTKLKIR